MLKQMSFTFVDLDIKAVKEKQFALDYIANLLYPNYFLPQLAISSTSSS